MSLRYLMGGAAVAALSTVCAIEAQAQQTAAAVRGAVTDSSGAPVAGASVTITHAPSGTVERTTTGAAGGFWGGGLRVGGPYTIVVSSAGLGEETIEGIVLDAGETEQVSVVLGWQSEDRIVVTGWQPQQMQLNNGVGSSYTGADILNQPSANRDVVATLLRDPLANSTGAIGNISIGGRNGRFTGLAIDGLSQGDDFGLSTSIYPTNRSPVSLDIIESASVVASDYSVIASGFTGGLVNVVTKSGANEFGGSAYYYRTDQDYRGNVAFDSFVNQPEFLEEEYGFTLGGPIIRDQLFFFAGYDKFESGSGVNFVGADGSDDILDVTIFEDVAAAIQTGLGYDPGTRPLTAALPVTSERYFGKIDWNINDRHRAAFTYQTSEETDVNVDNLSFTSSWYAAPLTLDAYGAQLYSDWTDNLSSTLRISLKEFERSQDCNAGTGVGAVEITLDETESAKLGDEVTFLAGCDRFRHGNTFEDSRLQLFGSADYVWNEHVVTFGGEYEQYELDNLFLSDSLGTFRFDTLGEVLAADSPSVTLRGVAEGDPAAAWSYDKLALFAQDEWRLLPNLVVNAGLRYEYYMQDDEPPLRQDFIDAYGRTNQSNLDGVDIFLPRLGFRYDVFDRTTISGGFGLFAGGDPKVWTSNAFSPQIFEEEGAFSGVDPTVIPPALVTALEANDPSSPTFIDTIAPNFEIPSDWKASVRLDQDFDLVYGDWNFGEGYVFTAQILYTQTKDNFHWVNLAQTELGLQTGVAPDGRPIYPNLQALGVDNALELSNIDGGESFIWSIGLANQFDSGFGFDVSYAHQDVDTVTPGSSSRGVSNWRGIFDSDRNHPGAGRSPYETEHKFTTAFSYEREIFGDLPTRFDLFGVFNSGEPFSYTFNVSGNNTAALDNSLFGRAGNGESPFDNDLVYIPMVSGGAFNDPSVVFAAGFDQDAFLDLIEERGIATGGIIGRNSDESAWNQRWDLRIQQDLPFANFGLDRLTGNRAKFVVDIENVANLLNDEWGTQLSGQSFDARGLVVADLVTADDVALNGVDGATGLRGNEPAEMCQAATDCLYRFNSFSGGDNTFNDVGRSVYRIRLGVRYEF